MTNRLTLSTPLGWLFIVLVVMSLVELSQAKLSDSMSMTNDDDDEGTPNQRRTYDLKKLRHFLLTANTDQRAAKREQQDFFKRELIQEYLRSIDDPSPARFEEIKKRFKTYCNSYEDLMNSNWAACG